MNNKRPLDCYACPDRSAKKQVIYLTKNFDIQHIFVPSIVLSNGMKWKLDYQHSQKHSQSPNFKLTPCTQKRGQLKHTVPLKNSETSSFKPRFGLSSLG